MLRFVYSFLIYNTGILKTATIRIQNWAEQAHQLFSPIKILSDITIINPWAEYTPAKGETTIVINPGMAFGTGYHATTQLSAKLIEETISNIEIDNMCDVGSGSAILSIIAAKKGVKKIESVEIDTDARTSATENIEANGCKGKIKLFSKIDQAKNKYDLVVANILFSIIMDLKNDLIDRVTDGGFLVLSGITADEDERLIKAFEHPNLTLVKKEENDGWMGYIFKSKVQSSKSKGD